MATITVKRKAYTRKAYTRKGGIHVKATKVPASTFKTEDRGEPGRTPKSERWYAPSVTTGWRKDQPASTRRRLALKAHKGDKLATARALQSLANVTTDSATRKLARSDALYFFDLHRKEK